MLLLSGWVLFSKYPQVLTKDFLEQSSAEILVEGSELKLKFDIKELDQPKARNFLQKLGVQETLLEGVSLELDPRSLEFLRLSTPAQVNLAFGQDSLTWQSKNLANSLQSSLPKNDFNFATGSARINLKVLNSQSYKIEIKDPKPLVDYASVSGKVVYSRKIEPSLTVLSKIDTITLNVSGQTINGEVKLK